MAKQNNSYDSDKALNANLEQILDLFQVNGVERIFFKELAPNDNSKNQIYLGGHLNEINWLPKGNLVATTSNSKKTGRVEIKYTNNLDFTWIDAEGAAFTAPRTKLIYYPQYPEVRLSGFLQGCDVGMEGWMDPYKRGRSLHRFLIIGVNRIGRAFGYLAIPGSRISAEIISYPQQEASGTVSQLLHHFNIGGITAPTLQSKSILLAELKRIHLMGFIRGKKLQSDLTSKPYSAANGGGFTLEAELGIVPNGSAKPDYLGWEIKQFGVPKWRNTYSKAITLLTPEPNLGEYKDHSLEWFLRKYGYSSTTKPDRWDFNGTHRFQTKHSKTNLTLDIDGFDLTTRKITKADGKLSFIAPNGAEAATWSFPKLMEHWTTKHSKAVYIPSIKQRQVQGDLSYHYGNQIRICEGTSFELFLSAFADNLLYLDPAIKLENMSTTKTPKKKRNQFRVKWTHLVDLYQNVNDLTI